MKYMAGWMIACLLIIPNAHAANCPKGASVEVKSAGSWYGAKIINGPDQYGSCEVAFDGYGSHYNEWVAQNRIRASSQPARAQASPSAVAASSTITGKYQCYTFTGSQLVYAGVDFTLKEDGRYAYPDGKGGTYAQSGDKMSFTGPMSNAVGELAIKSGRPQITLIFDGDRRKSFACSRAR